MNQAFLHGSDGTWYYFGQMGKNKAASAAASALARLRVEKGPDMRLTGAAGGRARKLNNSPAELTEQSRTALFTRWRNHFAGAHAVDGIDIREDYAAAVAAMTPAETKKAIAAYKERKAKKRGAA